MNLMKQLSLGVLLTSTLLGGYAHAEIVSSVISSSSPLRSKYLQDFSKNTPCYIDAVQDGGGEFAKKIADIFIADGFNITNDDSVECKIKLVGTINGGDGNKTFNLYDVSSWQAKQIQPNKDIENATTNATQKAASRTGDPINNDSMAVLTQVGGLSGKPVQIGGIGGTSGQIAIASIGTIVNIASSLFSGDHSSPAGIAIIHGYIDFGRFIKTPEISSEVYAASNTPADAEELFASAIKKTADNFIKNIYKYHIDHNIAFDMPISPEVEGEFAKSVAIPPILLSQPVTQACNKLNQKLAQLYSGNKAFLYQSYDDEGCKIYRNPVEDNSSTDPLANIDSILLVNQYKSKTIFNAEIIGHHISSDRAEKAREFISDQLGEPNPILSNNSSTVASDKPTQVTTQTLSKP